MTRCCVRIPVAHSMLGKVCSRPVKYEVHGKHYCDMHNPEEMTRRHAIREAKYKRDAEISSARYDVTKAEAEVLKAVRLNCSEEALSKTWSPDLTETLRALDTLVAAEKKLAELKATPA